MSTRSEPRGPGAPSVADADSQRLNELGYAQELSRGMGWFSNFAVSFTIISILTGGVTTYYLAMAAGGPRTATLGWLLVGLMSSLVALSMAEACSAYPTAGGLYYWAAKMAKPRNAALASWFTGWFNLVGQVAVTASIDFGLATIVGFFLQLTFLPDFAAKPWQILVIYTAILAAHGLLNTFGVKLVALLNDISVWWHLAFTAIVVVVLFAVPDTTTPVGDVFTTYSNTTGFGGAGLTTIWVTAVGLMLAQYTITGFDASAHMTEETRDAAGRAASSPLSGCR